MEEREENILDLPEKKEKKRRDFYYLRFGSTLIMAFGLVARLQYWPWSRAILIAGILLWTIWNLLHFFSIKRPVLWEVMYFGGRLCLAAAIFLVFFSKAGWSNYAFLAAAICFAIGYFSAPRSDSSRS